MYELPHCYCLTQEQLLTPPALYMQSKKLHSQAGQALHVQMMADLAACCSCLLSVLRVAEAALLAQLAGCRVGVGYQGLPHQAAAPGRCIQAHIICMQRCS